MVDKPSLQIAADQTHPFYFMLEMMKPMTETWWLLFGQLPGILELEQKKHYALTTSGRVFMIAAVDRDSSIKRIMLSNPYKFQGSMMELRNRNRALGLWRISSHSPNSQWVKVALNGPTHLTCSWIIATIPLLQRSWQHCWNREGREK